MEEKQWGPKGPGNGVQAEFLLPHSFLSSAAETVVYPTLREGEGKSFTFTNILNLAFWESRNRSQETGACDHHVTLPAVVTNLPP